MAYPQYETIREDNGGDTTMNNRNEQIIKYAAERSGIFYPVDEKTHEFSESFIGSFGEGLDIAMGKKPVRGKKAMISWLDELITDTEGTCCESRRV
jgi:hypothetical protein